MVVPSRKKSYSSCSRRNKTKTIQMTLTVAGLCLVLLLWTSSSYNSVIDSERVLSVTEWNTHHGLRTTAKKSMTLTYRKPSRQFEKNRFSLDDFYVNGVNLAQYGFETTDKPQITLDKRYELFDNFEIEGQIKGTEYWKDMVHYHRDLEHKSLIFYMDKVSQKRWMAACHIPMPSPLVLKYKHELLTDTKDPSKEEEESAVSKLLPDKASYVVKPTHKSSSSGVWLVRYDPETKQQYMGYSGEETKQDIDKTKIAHRVVSDLHKTAADFESWALLNAQPGFVVEERFSAQDSDLKAAYEFKTFVIWGRVYMAYLKRGAGDYIGLVYRNGTMIKNIHEDNCDWDTIPDWLMFDQVIALAEHLGRNKDMFRADIFVGIPSSSLLLNGDADMPQVQIAVSETEFHPTSAFQEPELLEEASRLWMAGYQMGIHKLIENDEVPREFLENGYLTEENARTMKVREGDKWTKASSSSSTALKK